LNAIETHALTKYYGKARGVLDLNLTVESGAFFGFIGPNGAGKSTTIRCLLGLIHPSSGGAMVLGQPVGRELPSILRDVGYLPAEAQFYSGMQVRDLLRYAAELRRVDCREEAAKLCDRLQLDVSRKIAELSLGNRKKAAIVCALQHNPRLCILDEPTSGLDPLIQREFFALLEERNRAGATIFLSSHVLSEIQRHCTHAAIIREGRLIACDRVEALAQTGARRVTLHGVTAPPPLPDIRDLSRTSDGISFLYSGDVNALICQLAALRLTDLTISEPDLEEIFLHYYQEGGEAK